MVLPVNSGEIRVPPQENPNPKIGGIAGHAYGFVKSILANLGNYFCHSIVPGLIEEEAPDSAAERPILVEMRLDCHHSIVYNAASKQYTLIAPAPPIKNIAIAGGGAKGVILTGVVEAFDTYKTSAGTFREQIENIAGSSIGAITAALIASGMSAERFIEVTHNTDFKKMLGKGIGPVRLDGNPILTFLRTHLKESIGNHLRNLFEADELSAITREAIEARLQHLPESDREAVAKGIEGVIREAEKEDVDDVRITFGMLHSLHRMDPRVFKDLTVTATCKHNGQLCYFDASRTPDLDIAIGCRASGSLPLVLMPVSISREMLLPGYSDLLRGKERISFVDGGYIDNIPVNALDGKQQGKEGRGIFDQNLQTLALVFDTSDRDEDDQSPFHNEKVSSDEFLNPRSFVERVLRDLLPRKVGGINTTQRNTLLAKEGQEKIRKNYTLRNIPLLIPLTAVDFKLAKRDEELYRKRGYQQTMEYLVNHENEMLYHTSDSLDALLNYLPDEIAKAIDLEAFSESRFRSFMPASGQKN